jgi:hypothetical protein
MTTEMMRHDPSFFRRLSQHVRAESEICFHSDRTAVSQ